MCTQQWNGDTILHAISLRRIDFKFYLMPEVPCGMCDPELFEMFLSHAAWVLSVNTLPAAGLCAGQWGGRWLYDIAFDYRWEVRG